MPYRGAGGCLRLRLYIKHAVTDPLRKAIGYKTDARMNEMRSMRESPLPIQPGVSRVWNE